MQSSWRSAARLLACGRQYKTLFVSTLAMGILGFSIIFLFPWLIGTAIDKVIGPTPHNGILPTAQERMHWLILLLAIGGLTVPVSCVALYGRGHFSVKLGNRVISDLRQNLFDHLNSLSLHFYSKEPTGAIVSRLINDIQQASQIISGGGILLIFDLLQMGVGLVLLLSVSWRITVLCLATLPLYAMTFRRFNPRVKRASERVQSQISKISGSVHERLAGIALVKAFSTEDKEREVFRANNEEYYGRVIEQSNVSHLAAAISEGLIHIGTLTLIGLGGYFAIHGNPPMTAGQVVKLLGWLGIMYGPVRRLAELNIVYQTSMAALDRVYQVLSITPRIREKQRPVEIPPQRGEVRFVDVRFRYADDSAESRTRLEDPQPDGENAERPHENADAAETRWILDGLNFTVAPGERVALVGPSGSGKSTLVSLLPRLYDVGEGAILIDGVDVRDYRLKPLRSAIGIVQQQSLVFRGSVRDNLCYGCGPVCESKLIEAAKAANAHGFISRLPRGYDTMLGERGVNLSGGQLQRISIARAILRDPKILILDEATSALDAESEALVQQALERVMRGRTCFIIAHRLSTIRHADRILVLVDGRVVESGSHDELILHDGTYARLARQQMSPSPWVFTASAAVASPGTDDRAVAVAAAISA